MGNRQNFIPQNQNLQSNPNIARRATPRNQQNFPSSKNPSLPENSTVNSIRSDNFVPYFPLVICIMRVGGVSTKVIMDTASPSSLINQKFSEYLLKNGEAEIINTDQKFKLSGPNGSELQITGVIKLPLRFGKIKVEHKFLIVQDFRHSLLLGTDFFFLSSGNICFNTRTVSFQK